MGPPPLLTAATSGSAPPRLQHLTGPALAAQLHARLMDETEPVEPAARQLTPGGVEREHPQARDGGPVLDEGPALAPAAEPQRLQPHHGEDGEAVVELGHVHIGRPEVGPLPHGGGGVASGHGGRVVELVPTGPPPQRGSHGVHMAGRTGRVGGVVAVGDHERGGPVARGVAVEQAQRGGDHAGIEVVGQVHGVAVDGLRVVGGVAPTVDGDLTELFPGQGELVHAALGDKRQPVHRRDRPEGERPLQESGEPWHRPRHSRRPRRCPAAPRCPGPWTPRPSGRPGRAGPGRPPPPGRPR